MSLSPASTTSKKILILDDDRALLVTLGGLLERYGFRVFTAPSAISGLHGIEKEAPDLLLLDLGLPDGDGLELLSQIRKMAPEMPIIVLTGNDSLQNAIESIKRGAFHLVSKPYVPEELLSLIRRALQHHDLEIEALALRKKNAELQRRLEGAEPQALFPGRRMREIETLIRAMAPSDANVLILGESGVGKEVIANEIHRFSLRREGPLVKLNCAALPPGLIEGELFGYKRGAFTGATHDFPGMIQEATGGTLFLDEIAEMPTELQTRFLRVLQERESRQIGSTKTVKVDFRLIAATNCPVAEALQNGRLRSDLYYRINTFQIEIPPLRERTEEIPSFLDHFLDRFARKLGRSKPTIDSEAMRLLKEHPWPGNIRELQNVVEYAVVLARSGEITPKELPPDLQLPSILKEGFAESSQTLDLDVRERNAILAALARSHGNKKKAAELLGIHRPTLYSKMKRYDIRL